MKCNTRAVLGGNFNKEKCFVHARCCYTPDIMVMTTQYLDVDGDDFFSGLLSSYSEDEGETWSEIKWEEGLATIEDEEFITAGCDATPMYHKKTGKIILLGHTAEYKKGSKWPTGIRRNTFYSVYDKQTKKFSKMKFVKMPEGFQCCGNGSGQSIELENGELLIPVYYRKAPGGNLHSMVMRCSFENDEIKLLEMGNSLTIEFPRGLGEPSIIKHKGTYYMTLRNDESGFVAKSDDGLHYTDLHHWMWTDGEILSNYNTQQHWMELDGDLYLVYTRRGAGNDHVFRHRAPLFGARVENMRLVRESEFVIVPERGARLGNFCAAPYKDNKALVMAAEWMQPCGCEKYGSDNSIFLSIIEKD